MTPESASPSPTPKRCGTSRSWGPGPSQVGGVWAAVRIPEGQVGVSANIPRISTLNLDDPDHYMASDNVFSLAEEMGWWDPASGKEFRFWEAYSGRQPYSTREFFILSTLAPSLNLTMEMEELPFSVTPGREGVGAGCPGLLPADLRRDRARRHQEHVDPEPVRPEPR